jgi:hypothetical protein
MFIPESKGCRVMGLKSTRMSRLDIATFFAVLAGLPVETAAECHEWKSGKIPSVPARISFLSSAVKG